VDARTDLYSVGILLYTLVAGTGPFPNARDQASLLMAHVGEVPDPPSRHASQPIPPELDRAVLRALEKQPEDRFQTADDFSEALASISSASTEHARVSEASGSSVGAASPSTQSGSITVPSVRKASTAWPAPQIGPRSTETAQAASEEAIVIQPERRPGRPRPASRAQVFVIALVVSTAAFSLVIALVLHLAGGSR
jgi:serine/threonine-protein kinase